jgi:hypothetical protein
VTSSDDDSWDLTGISGSGRNLPGSSDVDGFDMHEDPDLPNDDDTHLAAFRDELRAFADRPAPAMSQELARFVAGLGGLTEPVPEEASRRKRPMILQTLAAKMVAGGVAAFAMFSGLAVAGALPDGVQSAVSSAGDAVGVGLPNPEHQAALAEVETETTDSSSSSSTEATSSSTTEATASTTASTETSTTTESTAGEATSSTEGEHESAIAETPITGSEAPTTTEGTPTTSPNCRTLLPPGTTVENGQINPPASSPAIQAAYDAFRQCETTHQRPAGATTFTDDNGGEGTEPGDGGETNERETSTTRSERTGERSGTTTTTRAPEGTTREGSDSGRR